MAAIPLSEAGRAVLTTPVPWAKKTVVMKRASYPKGVTPPHLASYTEKFKSAVAECKSKIVRGQGAATVQGFNACISAVLK